MEFTLGGALKKHRRMRAWRRFGSMCILVAGSAVPWLLNFERTDYLICVAGAATVYLLSEIEIRLKVMQVRLAGMADEIDALRGKEDEGNLVLELSDW